MNLMKELQRKQKIKKILYSIPSLLLFAVITILLAKGASGIMRIERESAGKVKTLEAESQALALREKELNAEIVRLKTEEGVLEEIKEKFSVTREGEYVAIIVDEKREATSTDSIFKNWYAKMVDVIIFWK